MLAVSRCRAEEEFPEGPGIVGSRNPGEPSWATNDVGPDFSSCASGSWERRSSWPVVTVSTPQRPQTPYC